MGHRALRCLRTIVQTLRARSSWKEPRELGILYDVKDEHAFHGSLERTLLRFDGGTGFLLELGFRDIRRNIYMLTREPPKQLKMILEMVDEYLGEKHQSRRTWV